MTSPSRIIPREPSPEDEPTPSARPSKAARVPNHSHVQSVAQVIIALAVVLFLLVQAKFMLISLVTAIVLFSLTSDAINLIARVRIGIVRIPNWLASTLAVLVIAAGLLSITSMILAQVNTVLMTTLISYTERAPAAIAAMFSFLGEDAESAIFNSVRTVEISGYLRSMAGQAGGLMQGTVLVILFVGFLFAERVWFSVKLTNFVGDKVNAGAIEWASSARSSTG
jgi:AI-2 transport protein TqsA